MHTTLQSRRNERQPLLGRVRSVTHSGWSVSSMPRILSALEKAHLSLTNKHHPCSTDVAQVRCYYAAQVPTKSVCAIVAGKNVREIL